MLYIILDVVTFIVELLALLDTYKLKSSKRDCSHHFIGHMTLLVT